MYKQRQEMYKSQGYTLIELLIVIGLVGVLAGSLMIVVNQQKHKEYAEDAVIRQNLASTIESLEAYYTVERDFPDDGPGIERNPFSGSDSELVSVYIDKWDTNQKYRTNGDAYCIWIQLASSTNYLKYCAAKDTTSTHDWREIRECREGGIQAMGICN